MTVTKYIQDELELGGFVDAFIGHVLVLHVCTGMTQTCPVQAKIWSTFISPYHPVHHVCEQLRGEVLP